MSKPNVYGPPQMHVSGFGDRGAPLGEIETAARAEFGNWIHSLRPESDPAVVGPFEGQSIVIAIQTAAALVQVLDFARRWKTKGTPIHIGAGVAVGIAREFLAEQGVEGLELELAQRTRYAWPRPVANDPSRQSHYTILLRSGTRKYKVVVDDLGEVELVEQMQVNKTERPEKRSI
jgi:hypothetical protein